MRSEGAREVVLLYLAALNARDVERALAHVSRDVVLDPAQFGARGIEGLRRTLQATLRAVPDAALTLAEVVADGDRVACRARFHGTQTGMLEMRALRLPATGRELSVEEHMLFRVVDGLIVELHASRDDFGMLRQLGHLARVGGATGSGGSRTVPSDPTRAAR